MSWTRLTLHTDRDHAELWSDALSAQGALAVTLSSQATGAEEVPVFGEPGCPDMPLWPHCQIEVLLPLEWEASSWLEQVSTSLDQPIPPHHSEVVADQDWVRLTQSQFDPIPAAPGLWIVPTWHEPPDPGALNLRLDPGQAFGTGSHPTTRLCLEWLAAHPPRAQRILDYGCGSGILTIAAALLGAPHPVGVDIDPIAVQTARDNAMSNGVSTSFYEPDSFPDSPRFDGVIANILTNPLVVLAPLLLNQLRVGGWLTLSGILSSQVEWVRNAYAPDCPLSIVGEREGWVCLSGVKQVY
ncbi:50S ribosomal protein L11 methyltransferase [Ferrovum sp.]|uniref:50S ribosomal protein L11 methyltransferase n=1 Tax=Ferrovum sp. TaxID=2609467 RepID=UPI0026243CF2|nr:50S ribosomal protein L11 methyltransferase [Ferrovum sp.]